MRDGSGVQLDRAIDSIRVGYRFRGDLGNLDELCTSIRTVGLLQPITITPDGTLVCGARRLAAEFRADYSRDIADPATHTLVGMLRRDSAFFDAAWRTHTVTDREGGERTFTHPVDGFLRYMQTTFLLARHPQIKLVVLVGDARAATPPAVRSA